MGLIILRNVSKSEKGFDSDLKRMGMTLSISKGKLQNENP